MIQYNIVVNVDFPSQLLNLLIPGIYIILGEYHIIQKMGIVNLCTCIEFGRM